MNTKAADGPVLCIQRRIGLKDGGRVKRTSGIKDGKADLFEIAVG